MGVYTMNLEMEDSDETNTHLNFEACSTVFYRLFDCRFVRDTVNSLGFVLPVGYQFSYNPLHTSHVVCTDFDRDSGWGRYESFPMQSLDGLPTFVLPERFIHISDCGIDMYPNPSPGLKFTSSEMKRRLEKRKRVPPKFPERWLEDLERGGYSVCISHPKQTYGFW